MTDPNQTAFPMKYCDPTWEIGLTKREYIAAKVVQGLLAGDSEGSYTASGVAIDAVEITDELIKQLNKPQ